MKYRKMPLHENLSPEEWVRLLWRDADMEEHCKDWSIFSLDHWNELLDDNPRLVVHCDETVLQKLSSRTWIRLLWFNPALVNECSCLKQFQPDDWLKLLKANPQFARLLDQMGAWKHFTPDAWVDLLSVHPQFYKMKPAEAKRQKFTCDNWVALIEEQPQFVHYMPSDIWDSLSLGNWAEIIAMQPQFFKDSHFLSRKSELRSSDWRIILCSQPQLASDEVPWETFQAEDWGELLRWQRQFISFFVDEKGTEKLSDADIFGKLDGSQTGIRDVFIAKKL